MYLARYISLRVDENSVKHRPLQYEQQPERDPSGHPASDEPAESDSAAAPDDAASEADAATTPAAAEPQPTSHAGSARGSFREGLFRRKHRLLTVAEFRKAQFICSLRHVDGCACTRFAGLSLCRPSYLTLVSAELRDGADESADAEAAGHPAVAVLSARPAADAEENVGSAAARSELGQ